MKPNTEFDELRQRIEEFVHYYENNIDSIHDNVASMDCFLGTAINLLNEVTKTDTN